ncbi:MAG: SDR family NAD(P)-dependent oxidoreductase [Alphaproteobacteria bacterium]
MAYSDRVAIVTGGANGIGLACARRFARSGMAVVIADIDDAAGMSAQEELRSHGWQALFVHCDVGERLHLRNMLAATLDSFRRVDVLVNNAAIVHQADFFELDEDDFDRVLRINLRSAFIATQLVARQMVKQAEQDAASVSPGGPRNYSIINMSSINSVIAIGDQVPYAVAKGGVNQLTRVTAVALAKHGIRVNAIGPGSVNTDVLRAVMRKPSARKNILARTPLGRIADPDEVASVAAFLASDDSSYITGQCLYVDGGRLVLNFPDVPREELKE